MQKRFEPLTKARLKEIAQRDDCEVYEHVYTKEFDPWPTQRVQGCVQRLVSISRHAQDAEKAKATALADAELAEFSTCYQMMFAKLCDPTVSSNPSHVATMYALVKLHDELRTGKKTGDEARGEASNIALAGLLQQTKNAPKPPAEVEELD
tara:strand:+ start:6668 stop:7120 length:453 start_codon:yes stop_codon:yes gene_type:complete